MYEIRTDRALASPVIFSLHSVISYLYLCPVVPPNFSLMASNNSPSLLMIWSSQNDFTFITASKTVSFRLLGFKLIHS